MITHRSVDGRYVELRVTEKGQLISKPPGALTQLNDIGGALRSTFGDAPR
jgi:hypothetical protein